MLTLSLVLMLLGAVMITSMDPMASLYGLGFIVGGGYLLAFI